MRLRSHDYWLDAPAYAVSPGVMLLEMRATFPVESISHASSRVMRDPYRMLLGSRSSAARGTYLAFFNGDVEALGE